MTGIPRTRQKSSMIAGIGPKSGSGTHRLPLGVFSLETSPGVRVPIPGFNPVYTDVSTPFSEGKTCRDYVHKGPPYYEGDNFASASVDFTPEVRVMSSGHYHSHDHTETFYGLGTGRVHYEGGFSSIHWANGYDWGAFLSPSKTPLDTSAWELQAYKRTRPKLEKASAFVFAAEMRDIPHMLKSTAHTFHEAWKLVGGSQESKLLSPKSAADNFLNHQFGWVPFVGDIRKFYTTYQNAAALKAQLKAGNDKYTRRRVVLDKQETDKVIASGSGMQVEPVGYLVQSLFDSSRSPTWELKERKTSFVSAVGSYKYYRPEFDENIPDYNSAWNTINRELTLYGARITPSNVYRAVPWTWLIDWAADLGGVVDAMTDIAIDAIAARYLYVSRHESTEQILTQTLPFRDGDISTSWSVKWSEKARMGASTPYGFGLSWNLLSPRQLAILAALKISRS